MKKHKELKYIETEFPTDMLDRFIFAVEGRKAEMFTVEKPMTTEKAIEFVGVSPRTFYKLVSQGTIKAYYFTNVDIPFYFPSQIVEALKRSEK